jgi:hypothetical protein
MKGIASTGAPKTLLGGWVGGWVGEWVDGWVEGKAGLRIAYSNQKTKLNLISCIFPTIHFSCLDNIRVQDI